MAQYIHGRNAVNHALRNKSVKKLFLASEIRDFRYEDLIEGQDVEVAILPRKHLTSLVRTDKHQGVVALIEEYKYYALSEIFTFAEKKNPLIVILDEVSDPQNFGAIIRSCDELGADFIIVKDRNQSPVSNTVVKASAGATSYQKIIQVTNINQTIAVLKENGYWILGLAGEAEKTIYEFNYNSPIALVFGSEGDGISPLVKKNCDILLKIPTAGHVGSLNVSVSVGITIAALKNLQNS